MGGPDRAPSSSDAGPPVRDRHGAEPDGDPPLTEAGKLTAALESDSYVSEEAIRQAIRNESSFHPIHLESMVKVDVFVAKPRAWDRRAMDRRRKDTIEGESGTREVWVASPEVVILAKLESYRARGESSERQWQDVVGVIRVQGAHLDRAYLMTSADELGVRDLLDGATGDAGAP